MRRWTGAGGEERIDDRTGRRLMGYYKTVWGHSAKVWEESGDQVS